MESRGSESNRIEKNVVLNAARSRVWSAIADSNQFGEWFGMKLHGAFTEGETVSGNITIPGYEHLTVDMQIERIEPEHLFTYRWHPYAIDPNVDYSNEPTTLVEFHLADAKPGTKLTIIESGFEHIPAARRGDAFRMNDDGWAEQIKSIESYVTKA